MIIIRFLQYTNNYHNNISIEMIKVIDMKHKEYEKSIMYSVQVATLERILADGLIDEEEHKALLGKSRSKYNVLSDVDIIGG